MFWGLKFNRLILSLFENWKFFTRTKKVNDGYVYKMFELFICNAVVHVALVPSILVLNYLLIAWSQCFQSQVLPVGICRIYRWEPSEWICMSPSPGFRSNDTRGGGGGVYQSNHGMIWLTCGGCLTKACHIGVCWEQWIYMTCSTVFLWS